VAGDARQMPALRPSPIPIHDNGNVPGQAVEIDLVQEICFDRFCLHGNLDLVHILRH
jgi:hypothetical protein